jgi:hypothetical protein
VGFTDYFGARSWALADGAVHRSLSVRGNRRDIMAEVMSSAKARILLVEYDAVVADL